MASLIFPSDRAIDFDISSISLCKLSFSRFERSKFDFIRFWCSVSAILNVRASARVRVDCSDKCCSSASIMLSIFPVKESSCSLCRAISSKAETITFSRFVEGSSSSTMVLSSSKSAAELSSVMSLYDVVGLLLGARRRCLIDRRLLLI